ncbi:hypothetical protein [Lysobacter tyrosinilyticus]
MAALGGIEFPSRQALRLPEFFHAIPGRPHVRVAVAALIARVAGWHRIKMIIVTFDTHPARTIFTACKSCSDTQPTLKCM